MTQESDPYEIAIAERVNGILKDEFGIVEGFMNHILALKEIAQPSKLIIPNVQILIAN